MCKENKTKQFKFNRQRTYQKKRQIHWHSKVKVSLKTHYVYHFWYLMNLLFRDGMTILSDEWERPNCWLHYFFVCNACKPVLIRDLSFKLIYTVSVTAAHLSINIWHRWASEPLPPHVIYPLIRHTFKEATLFTCIRVHLTQEWCNVSLFFFLHPFTPHASPLGLVTCKEAAPLYWVYGSIWPTTGFHYPKS